uniref:Uncharacterized protein n=1 Tax=Lygus hesperus TaxID=30085 RepID=A0A146M081_LYGHE
MGQRAVDDCLVVFLSGGDHFGICAAEAVNLEGRPGQSLDDRFRIDVSDVLEGQADDDVLPGDPNGTSDQTSGYVNHLSGNEHKLSYLSPPVVFVIPSNMVN